MNADETHDRKSWPSSKIAFSSAVILMLVIAGLGLKPGAYQTILQQSFQSVGHFIFFAALAFLVATAAPYFIPVSRGRRWAQYAIGLGISIGAGLALEVGQTFIPRRTATLEDLIDDSRGAVAAILLLFILHHVYRKGFAWRLAQFTAAVALVALISSSIAPFAQCWADYQQRAQALPTIIKLNENWSKRFAALDSTVTIEPTERPLDWPQHAPNDFVKMTIRPGESYPGLTVYEPAADWRPYLTFAFDVYSPMTREQQFEFRAQDRDHNQSYNDRFNRSLTIKPGFQSVRISIDDIQRGPKHRELDLSRMGAFILFVIHPRQEIELVIGNFRFE